MFDINFFDEDFFTGKKGSRKDFDSPHYFDWAVTLFELFGRRGYSWLDVGCGLGFMIRHLQNLGEQARGIDISNWALKNSVIKEVYRCDLRDLKNFVSKIGIPDILCILRTLEYLPEDEIEKVLEDLPYFFNIAIPICIVISDHKNQSIPLSSSIGRLTMKPKHWWETKFEKFNLEIDEKLTNFVISKKKNWDGFWILKKEGYSEIGKIRSRIYHYLDGKKNILDLGCGDVKISKRAIGIDKRETNSVDVIDDIENLKTFPTESIDLICSSHSLEHCKKDYILVLKDWVKLLRMNGILILFLPDRKHYKEENPEHFHKFSKEEFLKRFFSITNLEIVEEFSFEYSFLIVAKKK